MRLCEIIAENANGSDIRGITKQELAKTGMTRQAVNDGYCGFLADQVVRRLGRGEVLSTEQYKVDYPFPPPPVHEWVFVDGKHYDAETVNGVANPRDLGYFRRHARKDRLLHQHTAV